MKPAAKHYYRLANEYAAEIDRLIAALPWHLRWRMRLEVLPGRIYDRLLWFVREHRLWWWWIP